MKKSLFILYCVLLFPILLQAAESTTPQNMDIPDIIYEFDTIHDVYQLHSTSTPIDAVLIIDVSHSMRHADPNRLAQEAMNLFIDMLGQNGCKVGIISYAGHVVESMPLTAIDGQASRDYIRDFINQLYYASWTDHSLGLLEAMHMMQEGHNPEHRPIIILLTDGNKNLNPWGIRTPDEAEYDLNQVLTEAVTRNIPIYTIGLNYDSTLDQDYIDHIAATTGALSFETATADNLLDIINAIIVQEMSLNITEIAELPADGELQTIYITIPDSYVQQANIIIMSNRPVTDVSLFDPQKNPIAFDGEMAALSESYVYVLVKIMNPEQGEWTLQARGVDGDDIRVSLLYQEVPPPESRPTQLTSAPYNIPESITENVAYTYENAANQTGSATYSYEDTFSRSNQFWIITIGAVVAACFLIFLVMHIRRPKRIFTGKLSIDIVDTQTVVASSVLCNLIPYGRKTTLAILLEGKFSPLLTQVILTPSPTAPSHLPRLVFKCASPKIEFRKDFIKCSAAQGIEISIGQALNLHLVEENRQLRMNYAH